MIDMLLLALVLRGPAAHCVPIAGLTNEYTCTVTDADTSCQTAFTVDGEYDCDVAKYGPTTRVNGESIHQWCDRQALLAAAAGALADYGMECGGTD
jgi:hypothetical protein